VVNRRKTDDRGQQAPRDAFSIASSVLKTVFKRWLLQFIVLFLAIGMLLAGVLWLGGYAREQLREHERFQTAFADIECNPPGPLARQDFLEEVRYHSRLPERFSIFEEGLAERLQTGFAKHPWVAKVLRVDIVPPQGVRVELAFRQPVLAVEVTTDLAGMGSATSVPLRGVDNQGVLLPKMVPLGSELPVLRRAARPTGGAGQPWGDVGVLVAAQIADLLLPQRVGIQELSWSMQGLILWGAGFKVIWGHSTDLPDEATTAVKRQRFIEVSPRLQNPTSWWPWMVEFDLRPRENMAERQVLWIRP
jgi:hypothetical protein